MPLPVSRKLVDPCFDKFRAMWMDNAFCDALIMAEGDPESLTIKAHRVVLSAFSSVLKHKFLEQPDPNQTIRVKYIDYNGLMFAIRLMYEGCVKIPDGDLEGFFQVVRSLAIKTGEPELDALIYDQDIAAMMSSTKKTTPVTPKNDAPLASRPNFQSVLQRDKAAHRIMKPDPEHTHPKVSSSNANPADSSQARVNLDVPPPGLMRPTIPHEFNALRNQTFERIRIGQGPNGSRKVFCPDNSSEFLNRTVPLPVIGGGEVGAQTGLVQDMPHRHNVTLPAFNEPPPPIARRVFLNPEDNLYWLEARNVVTTGEHAVKDKYTEFGLQQIAGDYQADRHLYLAFDSEAQTLAAMRVMESETVLNPIGRPPANIVTLWVNPRSVGMSLNVPSAFPSGSLSNGGGPMRRNRNTSDALKIFLPNQGNKMAVIRLLRNNGIKPPQTNQLIFDQGSYIIPMGPSDLNTALKKFAQQSFNGVALNPERVSWPGE